VALSFLSNDEDRDELECCLTASMSRVVRQLGLANMPKKSLVPFLLLIGQFATLVAQDISSGTLDRDKVIAGQTFQLTVTLPVALNYAPQFVYQNFNYKPVQGIASPQSPVGILCSGQPKAGDLVIEMKCQVPIDADGGIYSALSEFRLGPRPGATREKDFKIQVADIEVVPVQDTTVYPSSAVATISLDQKQILQNGAEKIEALLDQLNTRVDGHAAETKDLKTYLSKMAMAAENELQKTRNKYQLSTPKEKVEPIFFVDFDRHFKAYIVEVNAPPTANVEPTFRGAARVMRVQLPRNESVIVRPTPLDGSIGPYVATLTNLLASLRDGLNRISESQSDSFTISLKSTPPGATVSYKRVGEQYQDYSSPTDIDQAVFPYAFWTFRFKLGRCEVVKNPNPYIEKSPNLNPQMLNCQTK